MATLLAAELCNSNSQQRSTARPVIVHGVAAQLTTTPKIILWTPEAHSLEITPMLIGPDTQRYNV